MAILHERAMTSASKRSPGETTPYEVWARDMFDREALSHLDRKGVGILEGLEELWRRTLREGVHDSGAMTFTDFTLGWDDAGVETGTDYTDLGVQPFDNDNHARLRRWIFGKPGPGQEHVGPNELPALDHDRQKAALVELARTHAALIPLNPRGTGGWQERSEASRVLKEVESSADLDEALARLARLRERAHSGHAE